MRQRIEKEGGFVTLTALVILAFIFSLANAYFTAGSREVKVSQLLLAANQARLAAHAGVRMAAGLLVADYASDNAGSNVDHMGENWYLVTELPDGSNAPYTLDASKGAYFEVFVIDLSGRMKANATDDASATILLNGLPYYSVSHAASAAGNNYWTIPEYAFISGLGNDRVTNVSPYGSDHKVNVNTCDVKDDNNSSDPPDIMRSMFRAVGGSGHASYMPYKFLRVRRGGPLTDNSTQYDAATKDNNVVADGTIYTSLSAGTWLTLAATFTSTNPGSSTEQVCDDALTRYGRVSSEGYFLIKSHGWVVKTPSAGPNSAKRAAHRVMRVVKVTSSAGYEDCANREWYFELRDLPAPPYAASDYDYENSFYLWDSWG